jgi:DNA-binding response OmpR family regulator
MSKTRILVVDDEQDLVWALRHSLGDEGYEVLTAHDGRHALTVARHHHPDLVVLDVVMPELNGLQVCRRLRRDPTLASVPILFLTVRSTVEDRVAGLDRGGDDYLVKPFDTRELKARIRTLLRRSQIMPRDGRMRRQADATLRVGRLALDLRTRQARAGDGRLVQLTSTQTDLLHHLMLHPDEVFSSRQLLQQVWGYPPDTGELSTVRWHIKNLREKIEPDPADPTYIRTIPHQGYLLAES